MAVTAQMTPHQKPAATTTVDALAALLAPMTQQVMTTVSMLLQPK